MLASHHFVRSTARTWGQSEQMIIIVINAKQTTLQIPWFEDYYFINYVNLLDDLKLSGLSILALLLARIVETSWIHGLAYLCPVPINRKRFVLLTDGYFWRLMYRAYVKKQPSVSKTNRFFFKEPDLKVRNSSKGT